MIQRPPLSTRTDTLFPSTTLCRSIGEGFGVAIANGSETVEFDAIRNVISGVERSDAESGRGPSVCRIHIRIILGPLRVGQESAVKERRQPAIEPEGEIGRAHV